MNIAFVPARCGSKSIPYKNIKVFCGKPLLYWTLAALQEARDIDQVYVGTDCERIRAEVMAFHLSKVIVYFRDEANATDEATTESAMLEFLSKYTFDHVDKLLLVQATSPFTQAYDFDKALDLLKESKADSLLSCVRIKRFLWNDDGTPLNYDYKKRPRRQDNEGILLENGAFYINSIGNILKDKNRLSGKIVSYEMPEYTSYEIDEEHDWLIAEKLMNRFVLSGKPLKKIKLFLCDVDGTLTDAGMYYDEKGNELKKFNTHDGMGFELLRGKGIKTGMITSEETKIVEKRAKKLKVDYLYQGKRDMGKLSIAMEICEKEGITLEETAYVGDDINCCDLLKAVGLAACPANAVEKVKDIPSIWQLTKKGGDGAVREFIDLLLNDL